MWDIYVNSAEDLLMTQTEHVWCVAYIQGELIDDFNWDRQLKHDKSYKAECKLLFSK